ncbi:MAG: P-loop NTPase fold protein [Actinomycetota bacterium]|nr:P-loop NTPase fold protein [Actinomycetota bacterium]
MTARYRPRQGRPEVSLAGMLPAQALYETVCADPSASLSIGVVGAGGSGKSALLAALREAYLAAGVTVVGLDAAHPEPEQAVDMVDVAVLVDDAHQLSGSDLDRLCRFALAGDPRIVVAYRPWPRQAELDALE